MTKAERALLLLMANWLAMTIAHQRDRVVVLNSSLRERLTDLRREQQAEAPFLDGELSTASAIRATVASDLGCKDL